MESFGRLGEEGHEFIDELTTNECRRRERWGIDGTERGFEGTTSSGHFGGYTGSHLPQSPAVQAVITRMQHEEGRRAGLASNTSTPMIWGWSVDAL